MYLHRRLIIYVSTLSFKLKCVGSKKGSIWHEKQLFDFINCLPRLRCCRGWCKWRERWGRLMLTPWTERSRLILPDYIKSLKRVVSLWPLAISTLEHGRQVQDAWRPWKIFLLARLKLLKFIDTILTVKVRWSTLFAIRSIWHFTRFPKSSSLLWKWLLNSSACSVPARFARVHRVLFAKTNAVQVEPSSPVPRNVILTRGAYALGQDYLD